MDESRMQFEEWAGHRYGEDELQIKPDEDELGEYFNEYENHLVQGEWEAWQASRQAIEITIPDKISKHNTNANGRVVPEAENYDEAIQDCAEAILAAGVKLKGG